MTFLDVSENLVSNLGSLSGLSNLQELRLWGNQIEDVVPIANCTQIERLVLSMNQIADVDALSGLHKLEELELSHNLLGDLSPFAELTSLTVLHLDHNQIADLAPLVANPGIDAGDEVYVRSNPIDCEQQAANIAELVMRGVLLDIDCPLE